MRLVALVLAIFFSQNLFAKPERAIALSPAITEIIFALGLEKNLVGVTDHSNFPEEAKQIPSVGPYSKPDPEKILLLNPTVVFLPVEGPAEIAERLRTLNIKTQVVEVKTLDQVGKAAETIAEALGNKRAGAQFRKKWNADVAAAFGKQRKFNHIPVAVVIQSEPLMVAANRTFLNEVVTRCGARNIYDTQSGYPKVSMETLVSKKPQIILVVEHFDQPEEEKSRLVAWESKLSKLEMKNAVVKVIPPDVATRPGPRLLKGIEMICQIIKNSR